MRQRRLESFLQPLRESWGNEEFKNVVSTFDGFCRVLGLESVGPYLRVRDAQKLDDWSVAPLDDAGKALQKELNSKFQVI